MFRQVHGCRRDAEAHANVELPLEAPAALALACPDLAFLELGVWDATTASFRASAVLPLADLRPGFRAVALGEGADFDALLCFFDLG